MTLKLLYPALAQIFWTFIVLGIMFVRRRRALVGKQARMADVAASPDAYPPDAKLAAANFSNQFETPVLFFALIMIAMEVGATGFLMTALAWSFVATRVAHTLVHTGSNDLKLRSAAFALGVLVLLVMWILVVVTIV
jgi:hypothetical protein